MDDRMCRMILFQNCLLLEKIDPVNAALYQQQMRIIKEGIVFEYGTVFEQLAQSDECIPQEVSEEVINIVHMFVHIGKSIKEYPSLQQFCHFIGFNAEDENEWQHAKYAFHYLNHVNAHEDVLDLTLFRTMNQKPSCLNDYRKMMQIYTQYKAQDILSGEAVARILDVISCKKGVG